MKYRAFRIAAVGSVSILLLCPVQNALAQLDERCTVSVLNRNIRVNPDGSWVLPNVPANFGMVRARATCLIDGQTISGQSEPFTLSPNGIVNLPEIIFGDSTPIPTALTVTAPGQPLTEAGATFQLTVTATYADGSMQDVSSEASGTNYTVSNAAIAILSPDGLVTAAQSGTVIVQATHEGASGIGVVRVLLSGDTDGDGIPDDVELANGLNPESPVDALEDPDRDGLTNARELIDFGTDIRLADTDGDDIDDGEEVVAGSDGFVTNALLPDTDGDGIRDGLEVATGSDPTDPASFNLADALSSLDASPDALALTFNTIIGEAWHQLAVIGHLIDGFTVDLTSTSKGTNYSSNALSVCSFGAPDGRVFAGVDGTCTVTVSNSGFSDDVPVTVTSFTPTPLSFVAIPGFANNVDVDGDFAYVAAGSTGLQIVDVGNRASPAVVASTNTTGNANDVKIVGNNVFIADGISGLQIVDVSDPLALLRFNPKA